MGSAKYSLRWNNHQTHLLNAFEGLLHNETLVDVTLVCQETTFKAHKVVLSACSPYFQRIFCETPCKHPVIVLKDLKGWEMQAIVDFMYKGEISVGHEQLASLMNAAESLQVRGLAHTEQIPICNIENNQKEETASSNTSSTCSRTNNPPRRTTPSFPSSPPSNIYQNHNSNLNSPPVMLPNYDSHVRLPQLPVMPNISFNDSQPDRNCQSPLPRRKQAKPRRRSGESFGPQDLSKGCSQQSDSETAENLSMKKSPNRSNHRSVTPTRSPLRTQTSPTQNCGQSLKAESEESDIGDSIQNQPVELTTNSSMDSRHELTPHFNSLPLDHPASLLHHRNAQDCGPENSASHLPALSALPLTPPHSLFSGLDSSRNFLLNDILDPKHENQQIPNKKKMCRPKGQHSAPRGGPPRSWTNAELTEALQHVWNKKMTTSQASRIFGIPYNSLLMYVRGKYGKSLKLEKLKQECFGDNIGSLDLLGFNSMSNNNNNNNNSSKSLKLPEPDLMLGPPGFNPTPYPSPNFYPEFGSSFPIPMGMMHLLPQSDKIRESFQDREMSSLSMHMGYNKEDINNQRSSSAPIDYNKNERDLCDSSPLDFAKDLSSPYQHGSVKMDEESATSPQSDKEEMHLHRVQLEQNSQD
ncbi:hypothetical protein PGB90_007901 [Kerria lacca]